MSLPHVFLGEQVIAHETDVVFQLRLSGDDAKHLRVLRIAPGEHLAVVDGDQDYFECEVVSFDADGCFVSIASHLDSPVRPQVVLVQGLAKGEKMDSVVRHATEVGVSGIIPLACSRSIVKLDAKKARNRCDRWKAIAKSASMQSGRSSVPEIFPVTGVSEAAAIASDSTAVIVCWEEAGLSEALPAALSEALASASCRAHDARIFVVVGPEGGLTAEEVGTFLDHARFGRAVTLGPTILRTETAGIVAPALVLYELEEHA